MSRRLENVSRRLICVFDVIWFRRLSRLDLTCFLSIRVGIGVQDVAIAQDPEGMERILFLINIYLNVELVYGLLFETRSSQTDFY